MFKKAGHHVIVTAVSLFIALFFYLFPLTGQVGEMWMYDRRLDLLRSPEWDSRLQFISIDNESLQHYGAFPWERTTYEELIAALNNKPPMMLMFDIFFVESKPEDESLAEAIRNASFPVILSYLFTEPIVLTREVKKLPVVEPLNSASAATGFIRNAEDVDGKVRRGIIAKEHNGQYLPSMDLVAFAMIRGVDPHEIQYGKNRVIVGDTVIPVDDDYSIYIDYYFPQITGGIGGSGTLRTIPARGFHRFVNSPDLDFSGKIIIVGAGSIGMQDDFPTPVDDRTYGSIIHLNILNTMLKGNFLRPAPGWINLAVIFIIAILFGAVISKLYNTKHIIFASVSILITYIIINLILFKNGFWLHLLPPILTTFSCALVVFGVQFFRTHKLFRQFVVPEVADKMVASDEYSKLGGMEKEVSILFSDIRGYTSLSENMTPSEVMEMLNEYHTEMVHIFEKHYGRVVDYMGDAQMVIFGAPIDRKDHAACACRAALETQEALIKLCEKWKVHNRTQFEVGTGICTGVVAIGTVGAEGHKQFTAIGDSTNVASRLQGQSSILGAPVVISPRTAEMIQDSFLVKELGTVPLKGKVEPMTVFTITGLKD
jgi:adenylate cyclase